MKTGLHGLTRIVLFRLIFAGVLIVSVLIAGCQKDAPGNTPPASPARGGVSPNQKPPSQTAAAPISSSAGLRTYAGEVRAKDQVAIVSKTSGRVEEVRVRVGDSIKAGEIIAVLEHQTLDAQVKQAEAALAAAEANMKKAEEGRPRQITIAEAALATAQAKLDGLLAGATKEQVASATAAVAAAQAKLDQSLAGATKEQIKVAESQLELAKRQRLYQEAQANISMSSIGGRLPSYNYEVWAGVMGVYDQQVQIASDQLELLKAPASPQAIAQLKAAVDAAQAQLDMLIAKPKSSDVAQLESAVATAQAQLELVKPPFANYELETSKAAVAQAKAALLLAQVQQAEAFLRSPINGMVSTRDLSIGALASPGTTVATVVSEDIEIVFAVEEKKSGQIVKGLKVSVITSTQMGSTFPGEVTAVSPAANRNTRTFDVYVTSSGSPTTLRPGMFVSVAVPES